MSNFQLFKKKQRTIRSKYRGIVYQLNNFLSKKADAEFRLSNIPLTYWVPSHSYFSKQLSKWEGYEAENSNWVLNNFSEKTGSLFVDVGANFGWYTVLFSMCAGTSGHVVAIEPEPNNLRLLRKNISANNATNVSVINGGVGINSGEAELSLNDLSNPGMHSLRQDLHSNNKVKIKIDTLDHILEQHSGEIELLKMDIEGFEVDALLGAENTLARTKHVLIEYTPKFIRACGRDPKQFLSIFEKHKFVAHIMKNGQIHLCPSEFLINIDSELAHLDNPQIDIFYIKL